MKAIAPPAIICYKHHCGIKRYLVGDRLGVGGFANVYSVESMDSHRIYACKVINKSILKRKEHQNKLVSEIKLHQSLNHENIVKFERYFDDKDNVYILLEICTNHSLMELLRKRRFLTEYEVRYFMTKILIAIKYLHLNSVIHRDLKLGNLLLDKNLNIKICDFGLATKLEFDGARKTTICGTPNYIAPEILNQKKYGQGHSYEVDIWSLGVIMFTLLTGKPPFETTNIHETYKRIKKQHYKWPKTINNISCFAKDLVGKILNIDPAKRPNLYQIENHEFFTKQQTPKCLPSLILHKKPTQNELFEINDELINIDDYKSSDHHQQNIQKRKPLHSAQFNVINNNPFNKHQFNHNNNYNHNNNKKLIDYRPLNNDKKQKNNIPNDFIFVVTHCDYSKKYGIGYILSNGSTGIYFNDSTKMILHKNKENITYIDDNNNIKHCELNNFPNDLAKKVKLLQYFQNYLWDKIKNDDEMSGLYGIDKEEYDTLCVRKWLKQKYAVLFRLTNNTVQVNFTDESKLIFQDSAKSLVLYQDKNGNKQIFTLQQIYKSNKKDLLKRFKYTQQLLTKMKSGKNINR